MKLATYNIWNSNKGMPKRMNQLIEVIKNVDADVICLQEVSESSFYMLCNCLDMYSFKDLYITEVHDGLALLSKFQINSKNHIDYSSLLTVKYNDYNVLVINTHLPWDSVVTQEKCITSILNKEKNIKSDYTILAGDFNCSDKSSVHSYLVGDTSIRGNEAKPCYYDLGEVYSDIENSLPLNTLNIRTNPRWKGKNTAYTSSRVDRIYLKDAYPKVQPVFVSYKNFGMEISSETGYSASDHYGVVVEIEF